MAATSTLRELWDTTRMRLLVEIERQGSVSAAAAAIGIGQPSASQHLRLLEAAARQPVGGRRGSRLTDAGHVLAARAAQALASLGAAEEELGAIAGLQTGTIHLGASTAPGVYLLPDTLGCFRRDHPGVTVEVEVAASHEILERLRSGRVQLALVGAAEAGGVGRGDWESFRLAGRKPLVRHFSVARLAGRPLSPAEQSFVATLTRCCAKQADYASACVGTAR